MSDGEHKRRVYGDPHMDTNMDLMTERAIASLVERGAMTPEEAAMKRTELRQSRDAAGDRADRAERRRPDKARGDGED